MTVVPLECYNEYLLNPETLSGMVKVLPLGHDLVKIVWADIDYENSTGSLVFIGSYITASARVVLVDNMKHIWKHVCYCDTDSIHTDEPLP